MSRRNTSAHVQSRRSFLKKTAWAAAGFTIVPRFVLGRGMVAPSDKINLGIIGLGRKGIGHAKTFGKLADAQIVAGSDVWVSKQKAFTTLMQEVYSGQGQGGNGIATFMDYQEMIAWPGLDGVIVATPDHWHALQAFHAMRADKDVYCEKPLTHTIEEGRLLVKTAKKNKRIFQTGSQQRSNENFHKACTLVRNGYIGDLKNVWVNVGDPAIDYNLPEEQPASGEFDWDRWCGPSPMIHYNRYLAPETNDIDFWPKWRDFKATGGGILSDWGAHMFDIAQWGMGMDDSGPIQLTPPSDPKATRGLRLTYANGVEMEHKDFDRGWAVRFLGSEGHIDISRKFFDSSIDGLTEADISNVSDKLYPCDNHFQNWLDCIRSREQPICPAEVGHRTNSISCISNIAYWLRQPLDWNPKKEQFKQDEANVHLSKENREPYVV